MNRFKAASISAFSFVLIDVLLYYPILVLTFTLNFYTSILLDLIISLALSSALCWRLAGERKALALLYHLILSALFGFAVLMFFIAQNI